MDFFNNFIENSDWCVVVDLCVELNGFCLCVDNCCWVCEVMIELVFEGMSVLDECDWI